MDSVSDILARARALVSVPPTERVIMPAAIAASNIAEAHFRAECEQWPVTAANVTVYPIGAWPM
ncbi:MULTISPECIES: hypothetical protein [unclassified Sphingomonas]|uniref:hypothetical protein n=1 Tax=unclassified Sphingomonas TaxID=196159 RepID=UPI00226A0F9E|nr:MULTISPECIES: hypothetical protein [unclassified Sphingomonas]